MWMSIVWEQYGEQTWKIICQQFVFHTGVMEIDSSLWFADGDLLRSFQSTHDFRNILGIC